MGVKVFEHHYGSLKLDRSKASDPNPSSDFADVPILALGCGIGLIVSVPLVPLLTKVMMDEDTFSFLVGMLG